MNELTVEQTHQAFSARLAAVQEGKLELAKAVRDCCIDLPLGEILTVAKHKLQWIEAFCTVWGGFDFPREGTHHQRVLLLNGRLIDEPQFVIVRPDPATNQQWDANWEGPKDGWYSVAAEDRYNRLREQYPECDVDIEQPVALSLCGANELSEAAKALPGALAAWHSQQHKTMDALAGCLRGDAESIRQQNVMEANKAKHAGITEDASGQKVYMVVCADMAYYSENERSLGCHEVVYTSAPNADAALDQAKQALRDSGIPLVALDQAALERTITEMAGCELKPGEARNWTRGMTDLQMQAAYAGVSDYDELGV